MPGDVEVIFFTLLIADYKEQVESTHDRRTDVHVVVKRASPVVSAMYGVSSGQDRSTSIQGGVDTSLSDGDSLLLHSLMDSSLISRIHPIELVNTADTMIG
jgi:hypothetical protein